MLKYRNIDMSKYPDHMHTALRILLILTIFLFPILNFNFGFGNDLFLRFLFLLAVCAVTTFLFIIEVLKKKERIVFLPLYWAIFAFLIFSFAASFFSADFYNSIFGFLGENLKSLLGLLAFTLTSFLIVQVFNKEFFNIIKPFFAISYLIFALTVIFTLQYNYTLPLMSLSYLPTQMDIFFIIGFFLIINLFNEDNVLNKTIKIFLSVLIFYLLLSFNDQPLWIFFGLGALVDFFVHYFSPLKAGFNINFRLVIFALSLFFIISQISLGIIPKMPSEISLSYGASFDISLKAVLQRPFGWGFNNFDLAYALNKPQAINFTNLYAVDFAAPRTFLEEIFVSTGIFGGVLFLTVLAMLGYYLLKILKNDPDFKWLITFYLLVIGAGFLAPFSSILLYLLFISVIFISLLLKENTSPGFSLNQEIVGVFSGVLALVAILALVVRFFAASYYFTKAAWINDSDLKNESLKIALAQNAIAFNPYNPLYVQQYSAYLFNKAKEKTFSEKPDFQQIGGLIQAAIQSAAALENQYKDRAVFKHYLASLYVDARVYADKPEDFLNMAEKFTQEAIKLAPKNVVYKSFLGDVYYLKAVFKKENKNEREFNNLLEQAQGAYQEAKNTASIFAPAYFGLAQVHEQKQNLEEAKQNFAVAAQLDARNIDYRFNLARVLYNVAVNKFDPANSDEWKLAKSYLEDILEASPNYSNALYTAALIYEKEGDVLKAKENLEKLLKQLPEGKQKEEIRAKLNAL